MYLSKYLLNVICLKDDCTYLHDLLFGAVLDKRCTNDNAVQDLRMRCKVF